MNKLLLSAGSIFLISGVILFGMVHMAIANYAPNMPGWSDPPGKFSLAMEATMLIAPYVTGILFMIIGILLFLALYRDLSKNNKNKVQCIDQK
ncbi:hypothetical protein M5W83_28890 [Paenibacillus thiaminolyticus]|uniref:Uncharacterized protein n=1 Tax=Paenibacillus thiaminolyticus TaxID=49283 RepID=A0AAP9DQB2_PANTH|nr:hypothetical protein [Paenibacillus thiaminolyticus]MCY9535830.1 hypothetical protein [Paenibacillus thiaminolyticus]MCY9600639.1 hypothetical protein [Paenibacillus thiaminolyticus]MCY9611167.1 hypothetical protein [Paenibacillus thiaminolyticus]MCY9614755.1 hypothetical protein [Paenibacillus thiaminolyticus]MCY9619953.1 hypothetical protein [Paenibacillus thiaminolyticus]